MRLNIDIGLLLRRNRYAGMLSKLKKGAKGKNGRGLTAFDLL